MKMPASSSSSASSYLFVRIPKDLFVCYVLLVLCVDAAVAQFLGQQQQQQQQQQQSQFQNFPQRNQLSPQQQTHILSDIQQHQHRFNLHPSNQQFPTQQFDTRQTTNSGNFFNPQQPQQPIFNQQTLFNQQQQQIQFPGPSTNIQSNLLTNNNQQQILQNQQLLLQDQQLFLNNQHVVNPIPSQLQQSALPAPILQQSSITLPTSPSQIHSQVSISPTAQTNRVVQHHTQTSFTPNYAQQINGGNLATSSLSGSAQSSAQNLFQQRPTVDPLSLIEQQIRQLDPEKHKLKIKELKDKLSIIEKHNQFVQRQYEKSLKKAQEDHQIFLEQQREQRKKLYQRVYRPNGTETIRYTQSIPRYIYPEEAALFKLAVQKYYQEHPTTTTTTTTTTTPSPTTTEKTIFKTPRGGKSSFLPTVLPSAETKVKSIQSLDDLNLLQKQYKTQQINKNDLLAQLRLAIGGNPEDEVAKNLSSREISLANGKRVQLVETSNPELIPNGKTEEITLPNGERVQVVRANNPNLISKIKADEVTLPSGRKIRVVKTSDPNLIASASSSSVKTQEITLPNGQKVEIIKTTDPSLVPGATPLEPGSDLEKLVLSRTTTTTTTKPPKVILDELTKSVIPPGSNFELLKTGASGGLEQIGGIPQNLPNQKKVTFVLLEEQDDGTLKVQGIKGSGKDKSEIDVDSILKRIKEGDIKLPPSAKSTARPSLSTSTTTTRSTTTTTTTPRPFTTSLRKDITGISVVPNSFATSEDADSVPILKTNIGTHFVATSTPSSTFYTKIFPSSVRSTTTATPNTISQTTSKISSRQPHILNYDSNNDLIRQASTATSSNQNSVFTQRQTIKSVVPSQPSPTETIYQNLGPALPSTPEFPRPTVTDVEIDTKTPNLELPEVLKKNGLYAMAKFLRQSGLDTILNETGPYTVFVPTDKAFRTLLVQLGGPEKAEEKFKENPRLLSGLLLHHVIPGSFTIGSLQDEMTGVSLAGTQLRVNQYNMHDLEWNDIKITTINGAKILEEKKDIEIPQGIAHSIDRVMFPLPVGDIVQTLQSDREKRFTSFLRAIFSSGLSETLQGTKTFTVFAPTDKAFAHLSTGDLSRLVTDKTSARELVLRHLTTGTLYTNGMRYFQIRDSLLPDRQITLSKQSGKVKANNLQLTTPNIPATNGVIHAMDTLL